MSHSFTQNILHSLGIESVNKGASRRSTDKPLSGGELVSINPSLEMSISTVIQSGEDNYEEIVKEAEGAFPTWRSIPAPKRGDIIRELSQEIRKYKKDLGKLISLETGKIISEGEGEVQEVIDICDFAVGLSRQLYGVTTHSERPNHRMYEQWHPLGVVGIITAFNFPMAVWAWNAALAAVCGNTMVWKPSRETPICAIALQNICDRIMSKHNLTGVFNLVIGEDAVVGERLISDRRISLISATGSTRMGRIVAQKVSERFGRTILELGGNSAITVLDDADLNLALPAILFSAIGTSGQRCTTVRRLIMQKNISKELVSRLIKAYQQIRPGNPMERGVLMGPLINQRSVDHMMSTIKKALEQGGSTVYGGYKITGPGFFVEPTLIKAHKDMPILKEETFAPILYLLEVDSLDEAIELQNSVPQGLSSSIFTNSLRSSEKFLSCEGSDCGIANVNIGTSGAEIGLAFGGEKETGGGREAGSDAWKSYMRRQSCTINWSSELPLAQGIKFGGE